MDTTFSKRQIEALNYLWGGHPTGMFKRTEGRHLHIDLDMAEEGGFPSKAAQDMAVYALIFKMLAAIKGRLDELEGRRRE